MASGVPVGRYGGNAGEIGARIEQQQRRTDVRHGVSFAPALQFGVLAAKS
jgi:hypothetical protein